MPHGTEFGDVFFAGQHGSTISIFDDIRRIAADCGFDRDIRV